MKKLYGVLGLTFCLLAMGCGSKQEVESVKQDAISAEDIAKEDSDVVTDISEEVIKDEPATTETPGLYDGEGNLLCTWEEFGVDIEVDRSQYVSVLGEYSVESGKTLTDAYEPYKKTAYKVVLPEGIERIGNYTLSYMEHVDKIILPNSLKEIGVGAIGFLKEEITIPKNVEKLSPNFICSCKDIHLDERNPYFEIENGIVYTKGKETVIKCFNQELTELTLPAEVKTIYNDAFSILTNLEKLDLSQTKVEVLTKWVIPEEIYSYSLSIDSLKELVLPSTLTTIEGEFYCPNLEKINIPKNLILTMDNFYWLEKMNPHNLKTAGPEGTGANVEFETGITKIPDYCLQGINSLTSIIIPETVTEIGKYAFSSACGYKNVELILPASLRKIGESAFSFNGFSEMHLPDGLEIIGEDAFYGAHGYEQEVFVEIPSSVTEIGKDAFTELSISYEGSALDEGNNRWGSSE